MRFTTNINQNKKRGLTAPFFYLYIMPNYEYKCTKCGLVWSKIVPMSDYKKAQECPKCRNLGEKMVSAPALGGMDSLGRSK